MGSFVHPLVGTVLLVHTHNARSIGIRITASAEVRLTVPPGASMDRAMAFLNEKAPWIQKKLAAMPRPATLASGPLGYMDYSLRIEQHAGKTIRLTVQNRTVSVFFPPHLTAGHPDVQNAAKKGIEFALRHEAKKYLPTRLAELSAKLALPYSEVKINSAKTRWGSCSGRDSINLSQSLMKLAPELIDYVLVHELCHTVHKNHGPQYWKLVEHHLPNYKKLEREIKKNSTRL